MEGVFCIPFFVRTEADNNSLFWGCLGDWVRGSQSALWDGFGGTIFNMGTNSSPKTVLQCTLTTISTRSPRNFIVANRGTDKEKNSHGYDRRDWVQVGNQYSNLSNTGCKHQGSSGFAWLGAITEYVQKRNQIISSYGLQQTRCPVKLVPKLMVKNLKHLFTNLMTQKGT